MAGYGEPQNPMRRESAFEDREGGKKALALSKATIARRSSPTLSLSNA
jgi:hypothetical protein